MTTITSKRLKLKPPLCTTDQLNIMCGWLNDPEVVRYSEQRHQKHTRETQVDYIAHGPDLFREIHAGDRFIGTITADIDRPNSVVDVGILIGQKDQWSKGYGTEAWSAFCDHLLDNGIRKIEAGCMSGNQAMVQIFKNYNMTFEGFRHDHFVISPEETRNMQLWGKFK